MKGTRPMKLLAAVAAALSLSACATVTRGTTDTLIIQSDPPSARVQTTTGDTCTTPCALKLPRKSELTVVASKPGYRTAEAYVTNRVSGGGGAAMAGNVLIGGVVGAGVDVGTGAMLDLTPNPVVFELEPEGRAE
jgi:hypothetical protein